MAFSSALVGGPLYFVVFFIAFAFTYARAQQVTGYLEPNGEFKHYFAPSEEQGDVSTLDHVVVTSHADDIFAISCQAAATESDSQGKTVWQTVVRHGIEQMIINLRDPAFKRGKDYTGGIECTLRSQSNARMKFMVRVQYMQQVEICPDLSGPSWSLVFVTAIVASCAGFLWGHFYTKHSLTLGGILVRTRSWVDSVMQSNIKP